MMSLREVCRRAAPRLALAACLGAPPAALAACDDPVRTPPAAEVQVSASSPYLVVGDTLRLTVVATDASGGTLARPRLSWSSSDPAVAAVSGEGVVRALAPGKATITATSGTASGSLEVTVEPPVASVTLEPDSLFMVVGNSVEVRTPGTDHAANAAARVLAVPRDPAGGVMVGVPVRFASSNEAVATVSEAGVVRAVAPGTATVTARAGRGEGRLTVVVERPYTLTYLGTLPGLPDSRATGINALGQVVGYSSPAGTLADSRGWIWRDGTLTELVVAERLEPFWSVRPAAINGRGQVAGLVGSSIFLWEGGRSTLLPAPVNTTVTDLNERGEVVGQWRFEGCTRNCGGGGFIIRNGTLKNLSNYDRLRIAPEAINDAGQITGTLYSRGSGTETGRAFFLESDSAAIAFLPTSDVASHGLDLDASGRVVGQDLVGGTLRPFAARPGGAVTHLPVLPGGNIAAATAVSGTTIVGYSSCAACQEFRPVLFRGGAAVRINELFVPGDWVFERAADVNDRGQIVGHGRHRTTGVTGALLLTPPAP